METFLAWFFENLNYWTVTFLMLLESTVIPVPSEFVLPPAGYNVAAGDGLNIFFLILCGVIGSDLGATVNYVASYYLGRPIIYRFANSRFGHFCLLSEDKVKHSEEFFLKNGATSTLVGRLIPGIRHLISIPAGLAKMPYTKFLLYTSIGAGVWCTILAFLGYWLHSFVPKDKLMETITEYSSFFKWIILGLIALVVLYFVVRSFVRKRKCRTAE